MLSCVQLFATPWTIQSVEFSRPEYWSGSPSTGALPDPGIKPRSLHCRQILHQLNHQGSPGILEWVAYPFSSISSRSRNQTQVSHIASGFFTPEPPGKPRNTGVGSLSLLQGIFLTQESNRGLLYSRQILYQLKLKACNSRWCL